MVFATKLGITHVNNLFWIWKDHAYTLMQKHASQLMVIYNINWHITFGNIKGQILHKFNLLVLHFVKTIISKVVKCGFITKASVMLSPFFSSSTFWLITFHLTLTSTCSNVTFFFINVIAWSKCYKWPLFFYLWCY